MEITLREKPNKIKIELFNRQTSVWYDNETVKTLKFEYFLFHPTANITEYGANLSIKCMYCMIKWIFEKMRLNNIAEQ